MTNKASKIIGVYLLDKSDGEYNTVYDELLYDRKTGMLAQGTGVKKDFSLGSILLDDGKTVILKDKLPKNKMYVKVFYIHSSDTESFLNIYKTKNSTISANLIRGREIDKIEANVRWKRDSWHRIMVNYNFSKNIFNLFVDGVLQGSTSIKNIPFSKNMSKVFIGSSFNSQNSARSRMSNIRISFQERKMSLDLSGSLIDANYIDDIKSVFPVISDDITSLIVEFEPTKSELFKVAQIFNPKSGVYSFDINISDSFNYIKENDLQELIDDLVKRLRPAHTDYVINIIDNRC